MRRILSYDIAADLDTPVSAYLKLRSLRPRFLLESVEQGLRVARYSFIGFGDCQETLIDGRGLHRRRQVSRSAERKRRSCSQHFATRSRARRGSSRTNRICRCRAAWSDSPRTSSPATSSRRRCRIARTPTTPDACYVAPHSLLVFDHLTRGVTLLHAGSENERQALKREIVARARWTRARDGSARMAMVRQRRASSARNSSRPSNGRTSHIRAGDVYQLVLSVRFDGECEGDPFNVYRALRLLNPSPYMYYCESGPVTVVGSSPEALVRLSGIEGGTSARSPGRIRAAPMPRRTRRSRAACWRIRKRTPSTSCSWISRATTSAASRARASIRVRALSRRSSATAT